MKGPVEISPLNIATTRPIDLTIRVSIEVNASIIGVNITPPPTPAMTAITAMAVLNIKEPTTINHMDDELRISLPSTCENIPITI